MARSSPSPTWRVSGRGSRRRQVGAGDRGEPRRRRRHPVEELAHEAPSISSFTKAFVPVVDLAAGRIVADLPDDFFTVPERASTRTPAARRRTLRWGGDGDTPGLEAGGRSWCARSLTLFPEMFPGPLGQSLAGKALEQGRWRLEALDIRSFATDKHRTVDDTPFGGGPGW